MNSYLSKPFLPADLFKEIRRLKPNINNHDNKSYKTFDASKAFKPITTVEREILKKKAMDEYEMANDPWINGEVDIVVIVEEGDPWALDSDDDEEPR